MYILSNDKTNIVDFSKFGAIVTMTAEDMEVIDEHCFDAHVRYDYYLMAITPEDLDVQTGVCIGKFWNFVEAGEAMSGVLAALDRGATSYAVPAAKVGSARMGD